MRKILTSVLSVAGLLAVVLALASSPASAAKEVITINSPTGTAPASAGTYTVSWETQGGCDPGSGTSGATGSVTLTVAGDGVDDTTDAETGVVTDDICNYSWSGTFVNASGASCLVTSSEGTVTTVGTADDGDEITLVIGDCASTSKLHATVSAPGVNVGDCITVTPAIVESEICDADDDGTDDASTRLAVADDATDARSAGAVQNTTFTVTATPQKVNNKVPEGCNSVSEDTEWNFDTSRQEATLTVVDAPLGGDADTCMYTVTAALPAGFAAGDGTARSTANSQKNQDPGSDANGPDGILGTEQDNGADDNGEVTVPDLTVSAAAVKVYLVQNVIGDAGGVSATYKLTTPCGAPGLPSALTARSDAGGITRTSATNVVELRTGRFNVTAALADDPTDEDASGGVIRHALSADGDACEATVSVTGVPADCSTDGGSTSLASSSGTVILEVTVDCSAPVEPEAPVVEAPVVEAPVVEAPVVEDPVDDTGDMTGGDDDTGDMTGGDDDTGDMTGGDDDTGEDDTGPAEKQPTEDDTGGGPKRNGTG